MEQYNLYYFTEFENPKISKGWKYKFLKAINLIKSDEIPITFEIAPKNSKLRRIYSFYNIVCLLVLHREGGPAIEWADGDKFWYINEECHRKDGPAIEYINGKQKLI